MPYMLVTCVMNSVNNVQFPINILFGEVLSVLLLGHLLSKSISFKEIQN